MVNAVSTYFSSQFGRSESQVRLTPDTEAETGNSTSHFFPFEVATWITASTLDYLRWAFFSACSLSWKSAGVSARGIGFRKVARQPGMLYSGLREIAQARRRDLPIEYETTSALAMTLEGAPVWDFEIAGFRSGDFAPAGANIREGLFALHPHKASRFPWCTSTAQLRARRDGPSLSTSWRTTPVLGKL